jgi:hypothetical protein
MATVDDAAERKRKQIGRPAKADGFRVLDCLLAVRKR